MVHPNGGTLTIYVDCVSPYSWFGFTNALSFRPLLLTYGVSLDIIPFFLGAARANAGNPFQETPKWKEAFARQDTEMTGRLLGCRVVRPKVFPINSLFAVRVATWVKDHHPSQKFDATFSSLASGYWSHGIDISTPEGIRQALTNVFTTSELEDILKNALTPENKKRVVDQTMSAGAFGAPWIVGLNAEGTKRSWFGNDRWDQVFAHMGVPYRGVEIIPPSKL